MLALRPNGPGFVRVATVSADIEIPFGKPRHVFVRMNSQGWNVAGHLLTSSLTLRPRRIVLHDGFLIPSRFAHLELVEAKSGQLSLTVSPPPIVRRSAPATPLDYGCADVNVGPPLQFDAGGALPDDPKVRRPAQLRPGSIPLSVEPGAPPVASLQVTAETPEVIELEQHGAHSRIAIVDYASVFVFGWVPKNRVRPLRPVDGFVTGGLGLSGAAKDAPSSSTPRSTRYRCNVDLPVLARVRGEVMQVGSIDAGTPVETTGPGEGVQRLLPPDSLVLANGVSLETPKDAFSSCAPDPG